MPLICKLNARNLQGIFTTYSQLSSLISSYNAVKRQCELGYHY